GLVALAVELDALWRIEKGVDKFVFSFLRFGLFCVEILSLLFVDLVGRRRLPGWCIGQQRVELLARPAGFGPIDNVVLGSGMRQHQDTDALRYTDERSAYRVNVLPAGIVIVGKKHNVGVAKKLRMFRPPLLR